MSNTDPTYDAMHAFLEGLTLQGDKQDMEEAIYAYCKGRLVMAGPAALPNIARASRLCSFREQAYYTGLQEDSAALDYFSALNDRFGWI